MKTIKVGKTQFNAEAVVGMTEQQFIDAHKHLKGVNLKKAYKDCATRVKESD